MQKMRGIPRNKSIKPKVFSILPSRKFTIDQLRLQAEVILQDFEFEKVHEVMEHVGWTWGNEKHAPPPTEIRKTAECLLNDVIQGVQKNGGNSEYIVGTGGLRAEYHPWGGLSLCFVLEEAGDFSD